MGEYECKFIGAYNGKHGYFIAKIVLRLPFVPFYGLAIEIGGTQFYVEENAVRGNGSDISWSPTEKKFSASLLDTCIYGKCNSLDEAIAWFEQNGWVIETETIEKGAADE